LADSRLLDDVGELLVPGALAVGGLYLLWWLTRSTTDAVTAVPNVFDNLLTSIADYDIPIVGEGDLIDRWTLNPQEALSIGNRLASGVGNTGARILRWRPW
jgi:hypothetical protein